MGKALTTRKRVYDILEHGFDGSKTSRLFSGFIVIVIILNVGAIIVESYKPIGEMYHQEFLLFNIFSVIVFTVEYFARIWVSVESPQNDRSEPIKSRIKYSLSPLSLIDLLAIAPFYLSFIFAIDLRYLRMLRMLRLLKLTHYFKGLRLFMDVLKKELPSVGAAIIIMCVLVILSASVMYGVEHDAQPDVFDSIPSAIWWSVVTMTTVGYGDVTPVTFLGKFISIFIMLLGVGIVALPAAMLAAKFGDELRTRKQLLEREIATALQDGIITSEEQAAIEKLSQSMGISTEELEHVILNYNRHNSKPVTCEHCGKT
ncbi:Cyclic nucleotide-gated potassium channel [Pseudoalteromonas sp. P1-9]|uniref:ion transporter n=1 Tax=Pseudoalteromonas sp. P1-9 TaxID=1710354 RepID=UPI0006D611AD|nr:ion transporter [Pseudoalteromonas sp. P1-9]KPV95027.1 Cyclic nucleotide-gated potassium channel [Pseudoalteromonas sp. P1-9]